MCANFYGNFRFASHYSHTHRHTDIQFTFSYSTIHTPQCAAPPRDQLKLPAFALVCMRRALHCLARARESAISRIDHMVFILRLLHERASACSARCARLAACLCGCAQNEVIYARASATICTQPCAPVNGMCLCVCLWRGSSTKEKGGYSNATKCC